MAIVLQKFVHFLICLFVESSPVCREEPEEGCVCHNGLKRQGEFCVPEEWCGCEVVMPDGMYWTLPVSRTFTRTHTHTFQFFIYLFVQNNGT